jgi:hypothetical protein
MYPVNSINFEIGANTEEPATSKRKPGGEYLTPKKLELI